MKVRSRNERRFRKVFVPWYDTEPMMLVTLAITVTTLLFSLFGIAAALETPEYKAYVWVPCLLGGLSLAVTVSILVRLIRRGDV